MLLGIVFYMMLDGSRSALWCGCQKENVVLLRLQKKFSSHCVLSP